MLGWQLYAIFCVYAVTLSATRNLHVVLVLASLYDYDIPKTPYVTAYVTLSPFRSSPIKHLDALLVLFKLIDIDGRAPVS